MIVDAYEESVIHRSGLPSAWQSQTVQDDLESFLQQNWVQRSIFYNDEKLDTRQQFLSFLTHGAVRTNNYIGTITYKGSQLNIFPKVFREEAERTDTESLSQEHMMKNLIRWIEYCSRIAYPFINVSAELSDAEDLRELFITLYVSYVRAALDRGLFYQYIEETEDSSTIKGRIDIADYVLRKIPGGQADKFRCTYSKFEYDNRVNRIIKYTCRQLLNSTSERNQKALYNILMRLTEVSDVQCSPRECDLVRLSRMHGNYRLIISLSKMFLLNKTTSLKMDLTESFCFLFPAELLFEGFIGGFLQEVLEKAGGSVSLQQSGVHLIDDIQYDGRSLGNAFTMRHDILAEYNESIFILDTKYKELSRFEGSEDIRSIISNEVKQSDLYQICEYARKQSVNEVYLLYPMYRHEDEEPCFPVGISRVEKEEIRVHFIRVPFIFEEDEQRTKDSLTRLIKSIFGIPKAV